MSLFFSVQANIYMCTICMCEKVSEAEEEPIGARLYQK